MKAVVFGGEGERTWTDVPDPAIQSPTDVIVRMRSATICGTDLHILKGDVPETRPGTVLGHEGIGIVEEVGAGVTTVSRGDRVLLSCITACGRCEFCKQARYGLCRGGGGWLFGHTINGLQGEYARVPFADTSTYKIPESLSDEQVLCLSDVMPTAFEVGVLNGHVQPGDTVFIAGAGPIGLGTVKTARLYSPAAIAIVDFAEPRLEKARQMGADVTLNGSVDNVRERVLDLTRGKGVDVAVEAVGVPETFELCTELVRPGGRIAVVGVFGQPAALHLESLWSKDITITTGLVDTFSIPRLLRLIEVGKLDPTGFATHRYRFDDAMTAYDTFSDAGRSQALKVMLTAA